MFSLCCSKGKAILALLLSLSLVLSGSPGYAEALEEVREEPEEESVALEPAEDAPSLQDVVSAKAADILNGVGENPDARALVGAVYHLLSDVAVVADSSSDKSVDDLALDVLTGSETTRGGLTRACYLLLQELGLECVEVNADVASTVNPNLLVEASDGAEASDSSEVSPAWVVVVLDGERFAVDVSSAAADRMTKGDTQASDDWLLVPLKDDAAEKDEAAEDEVTNAEEQEVSEEPAAEDAAEAAAEDEVLNAETEAEAEAVAAEKEALELQTVDALTAQSSESNSTGEPKKVSQKTTATSATVSVTKLTVGKIGNQAYTGKAIKPSPKVSYKSTTLKKGVHYTLSYKNNVKAGTATVIIKGKGKYRGTRKVTFKIVRPSVLYKVHRQTYGWEGAWKKNGATSGTTGAAKRLEGIRIQLASKPVSGSIAYRTHIQTYGWESGWKKDGAMSGTSGQSKRLEAIQIKLTGNMSKKYDVWYRVHAQQFGWMGWTKNGKSAGSSGYSYRLEAIQIKILPKGSSAPGRTSGAYKKNPNVAAHEAYKKLLKSIAANAPSHDRSVYYRYANVYGGAVDEFLCVTRYESGSGSRLWIYTFANGQAKQMLCTGMYGDNQYDFYKKTSSFVLYRSGHGGELETLYTASGGEYWVCAQRGRVSRAGGGAYDGPWNYYVVGSESEFNRVASSIAQGNKITLPSHASWTRYQ